MSSLPDGDVDPYEHGPAPRHSASRTSSIIAYSLMGMMLLACTYTLYVSQEIAKPVAVALMLFLLLRPIIAFFSRYRVPSAISASIVVLVAIGLLGTGVYFLADPASAWLAKMPTVLERLQKKIEEPVSDLQDAKESVEGFIQQDKGNSSPSNTKEGVFDFSLRSAFFGILTSITDFGWYIGLIFFLLLFLLMNGDKLIQKLTWLFRSSRDREKAKEIAESVQQKLSHYLFTMTLINIVLGCFIAAAMYTANMPNAILWGVFAALVNFIPYIGPIIGISTISMASFLTFDDIGQVVLPPILYLIINGIEGQLVTPWIMGRRLSINPLIVFFAVVFWGWLWGTVGVFLAVPLLVCFKVVCEGVEALRPVAYVLDEDRPDDRKSSG